MQDKELKTLKHSFEVQCYLRRKYLQFHAHFFSETGTIPVLLLERQQLHKSAGEWRAPWK